MRLSHCSEHNNLTQKHPLTGLNHSMKLKKKVCAHLTLRICLQIHDFGLLGLLATSIDASRLQIGAIKEKVM